MTQEAKHWPEIALSRGDLALALGGFKSQHFFDRALTEGLKPGQRIDLVWGENGQKITLPVIVGCVESANPDRPLASDALKLTGRFVSKPPREPEEPRAVSKQTEAKKARNQARSSARSFMRAWEPEIPRQLTPRAIAGSDTPSLLYFHLFNSPDGGDKETMAEIRQHYRNTAEALSPYMQRAHGYMANGNASGNEFMPPPNDHSTYLAARFLARHDKGSIREYIQRMHGAAQRLAPRPSAPAPQLPTVPFADGIGQNQLLGGSSESVSLGRALLLFSGASPYVVTRQPLIYAHDPDTNYQKPVTMRLQALGAASKSGHRRHAVEVPMQIAVSESDLVMSRGLDDARAREYGYSSKKALLREQGIRADDNVPLYFTPVTGLTRDLPIDADRLGSYWNKIMDGLHDAVLNGKNGAGSKRDGAKQAPRNLEASVADALAFIATLPPEQQTYIHDSVARYWAMDEATRKQWLSHAGDRLLAADDGIGMETLAHHQLPADVRAARVVEDRFAPPEGDELDAPAEKPTTEKKARRISAETEPTHGSGWRVPKVWKAIKPASTSLASALDPETAAKLQQLVAPEQPAAGSWELRVSKGLPHAVPPAASNDVATRRSRAQMIRDDLEREHARKAKQHRRFDGDAPVDDARDPVKDYLQEENLPTKGELSPEDYLATPSKTQRTR